MTWIELDPMGTDKNPSHEPVLHSGSRVTVDHGQDTAYDTAVQAAMGRLHLEVRPMGRDELEDELAAHGLALALPELADSNH